jgi:hypothetical protein
MIKHLPLAFAAALAFIGSYAGVLHAVDNLPAPPTASAPTVINAGELSIVSSPTPAAIPSFTTAETVITAAPPRRKVKAPSVRFASTVRDQAPQRCSWRDLQQGFGSVKVCEAAQ